MKKTILIILVLVLVIGSAFADVRFSGFAKVLWGYDINNQKFTVSGQITILGLNVKLGYTFREFEPNKYFGTSKAYIELNF